jgi:hypothetical protein
MRIGGAARDGLMTLIPMGVAVVIAMVLLGGPEATLRVVERVAYDAWLQVGNWFGR